MDEETFEVVAVGDKRGMKTFLVFSQISNLISHRLTTPSQHEEKFLSLQVPEL